MKQGRILLSGLLSGWLGLFAVLGHAGEKVVVQEALLRLIDEVEIPAREAGALEELVVHEGEVVTSGQVLARLENRSQKLQFDRTRLELAVARRELDNRAPQELAGKNVELEQQSAAEQELKRRIARKRAENPLKVDAAIRQKDVAKNELDRALQARKEFEGSISASEIDNRRLTFEHADLSARQARFEQEIDVLLAETEDLTARSRVLTIEQAKLQLDDVLARRDVSALQVQLKENQVEAASEALARREIRSPINGTIVQIRRHVGEWVEPGEPCLRVVRLDRLRIEGFLAARFATRLAPGAKALVGIQVDDMQRVECEGTVTFISPEIDPVNNEVRLWVEVDNPQNQLRPGMHGSLTFDLPQP